MSITSTAHASASANGTNGNGNGHTSHGNGARAIGTTPRPNGHPAAQTPNRAPAPPSAVVRELRALDAAERHQATTPQSPAGATEARPTGFSPAQIAALSAPLDRARISSREQGRGRVNYLKGWVLIEEANRIFGFDGWQRQTLFSRCVTAMERRIGRDQKPGWGVTYIARVRITIHAGAQGPLIREGTGAGHGIDTDLGLAHESAIKEAETDAMKRALVTFGNPFGLALYDKSQRQVSGAPAPAAPAAAGAQGTPAGMSHGQRSSPANGVVRRPQATAPNPVAAAFNGPPRLTTAAAPSPATQRPAARPVAAPAPAPAPHAPLDPPTIRSLQDRIRGLLPPQLAAFSRAFRSAFQVPESTPSIAGLITEHRHHAWIQRYLAQGLGKGQAQARTA
ncbi:MAG: RAD52 family DNA repair protein [Cyanobacteriota bacterium]|nr:RAD52 family DNA repair protein [Cyanobacteriota bacterium]